MPIGEGLHHVFGRDGRMDNFFVLNDGAAFHLEVADFLAEKGGSGDGQADLVLIGRHAAAAQSETRRGVFESQANLVGETIFAQGVDDKRNRHAAAHRQA